MFRRIGHNLQARAWVPSYGMSALAKNKDMLHHGARLHYLSKPVYYFFAVANILSCQHSQGYYSLSCCVVVFEVSKV